MKTIKEFINENKYHLRNLYIEINEELRTLKRTGHSIDRKDQSHNGAEDVNINEIKELINKCDDLIVDKLLNNKIQINTKGEQFGIIKIGKGIPYKSFMCIFEVIYFNKETFEYDLKIITSDKYKNKIAEFTKNTKFGFQIDTSNYVKEIII